MKLTKFGKFGKPKVIYSKFDGETGWFGYCKLPNWKFSDGDMITSCCKTSEEAWQELMEAMYEEFYQVSHGEQKFYKRLQYIAKLTSEFEDD